MGEEKRGLGVCRSQKQRQVTARRATTTTTIIFLGLHCTPAKTERGGVVGEAVWEKERETLAPLFPKMPSFPSSGQDFRKSDANFGVITEIYLEREMATST